MVRYAKWSRFFPVILPQMAIGLWIAIIFAADCDGDPVMSPEDGGTGASAATPEEESRNSVWILFNNDCFMPGLSAPSFDANLCRALHPATGDESRLEALLALREMDAVRFDREDAGRLVGILRNDAADIRIGLMRGMTADSVLGMRVAGLTCDYDRMRLFLWGEEIPLE